MNVIFESPAFAGDSISVQDSRGLAQEGWHIPSDAEWSKLTNNLGGKETADKNMKSTSGWNTGANGTNSSSFTGLPCGCRNFYGNYFTFYKYGNFWTASVLNSSKAWSRNLSYDYSDVNRYYDYKEDGYSVRCVRD